MHIISITDPVFGYKHKCISFDSIFRFVRASFAHRVWQSQACASAKIDAVLPGNRVFLSCGKIKAGTYWRSLAVGKNIILEKDFGLEEQSCCGSLRRIVRLVLPEFSLVTTKMRCCCGSVSRRITFCLPPSLHHYLSEILNMTPDTLARSYALQEATEVLLEFWRTKDNYFISEQPLH